MTCSAALVVACGTLFALQLYFFRRDFVNDLATTAEIVSHSSEGAITLHDDDAGRRILEALSAKPQITAAAILLRDGSTLAAVGDAHGFEPRDKIPETGVSDDGTDLLYTFKIFSGAERLGALYLHADYRSACMRLYPLYGGILVFVIATSFLAAMLVSRRLERLILDPIAKLAETARHITAYDDYSVRAEKLGADELGSFTDSFNSMLEQIHSRDRALRHEIAERKRAEQELQKVHAQLVAASRQAGMAEVATGVLHNVGNVLNSVNVSTTLLGERLAQSRAANLGKAAALLRSKNGSLANFLTDDPKGRMLPAYLSELGEHLDTERTEALGELELLNRNIAHIKDIVSRQQCYARTSGPTEPLSAASLVEDALSLNAGVLERHGVTVVRHFEAVPPVEADKHKALQILVNVFRNAMHAMDEAGGPRKTLTIGIRARGENAVEISVADTGVGIAPENLTRIFSLGFTTRREGHGFGLHSAALAAQQMGGRLAASSDGPGRGAQFALTLPLPTHAAIP